MLYPNPRGSTSYGQEFGNVIQYHYPGDDYKDLMAGVDELIKRGVVDPKRLGVTGGSGGGVLTNWTITQTDRFAAAVSQRSISDWAALVVHGRLHALPADLVPRRALRGGPGRLRRALARSRSSAKVKTPLMLIEGEADWRTPAAGGGEQMFRALKYLKKPTVMVRFPDESHELVALRPALAPRRAAAAHRRLVRRVPAGQDQRGVRRPVARCDACAAASASRSFR